MEFLNQSVGSSETDYSSASTTASPVKEFQASVAELTRERANEYFTKLNFFLHKSHILSPGKIDDQYILLYELFCVSCCLLPGSKEYDELIYNFFCDSPLVSFKIFSKQHMVTLFLSP